MMDRGERATQAAETMEIVERGWYENEQGQRVDLAAAVEACKAGSWLYFLAFADRFGHPTEASEGRAV